MAFRPLSGREKLQRVTELLDTLEKELTTSSLSSYQQAHLLLQLRQHGTSPDNADPIYSKRGMDILGKYGVTGSTVDVRRAALRCIANALLLAPRMRQIFVDTGNSSKLAEMLKCDASEDELVICRILFFSTYETTLEFKPLIDEHFLADNLLYQLKRHLSKLPETGETSLPQVDELGLTDTLKLIFNIAHLHPELATSFTPAIPYIFTIINRLTIPAQPLDGIFGYLMNSLTPLDLQSAKNVPVEDINANINSLFPPSTPTRTIDKLATILDRSITTYSPSDLDSKAPQVINALIALFEIAPEAERTHMQTLLLPDTKDRSQPIGQSDTLSSKLLRLSTAPFNHIKNATSELLFLLSDRNPETLTQNIGYGYASGILATRGGEIPQVATGNDDDDRSREINPITGQRWDAETQDTGPPMSREEKEREAERLFVLFERARANGILNVENPVRTALHEGRFEELSDSDSDDK